MNVTKATTIAFAYTIKALGSELNPDYEPFFSKLRKYKIHVEFKVGEKDSKGKLHYHGIILIKKGFWRKLLVSPGYHLKLVEVFDKKGWIKYIHKDVAEATTKQPTEEDLDEFIEFQDNHLSVSDFEDDSLEDHEYQMPQKSLFINLN